MKVIKRENKCKYRLTQLHCDLSKLIKFSSSGEIRNQFPTQIA